MKNLDEFLKELSALTMKHRIDIGGCGCCGSPFLYELSPDELEGRYTIEGENLEPGADNLRWEPKKK